MILIFKIIRLHVICNKKCIRKVSNDHSGVRKTAAFLQPCFIYTNIYKLISQNTFSISIHWKRPGMWPKVGFLAAWWSKKLCWTSDFIKLWLNNFFLQITLIQTIRTWTPSNHRISLSKGPESNIKFKNSKFEIIPAFRGISPSTRLTENIKKQVLTVLWDTL